MDIERKRMKIRGTKGNAGTQITVEEDFIVPDSLGDMEEIIAHKEELIAESVKVTTDKVQIRGKLNFAILYRSPEESRNIHSMEGDIGFEESVNMDGAKEGEICDFQCEIEDINIHPIHSRKVCVRAVLRLSVSKNETTDREVVSEIRGEANIRTKRQTVEYADAVVEKHDIFRVRDEIELERSKPNIREILWTHIDLRGAETRAMEGKLSLQGELLVFVLYRPEDEGSPLQWLESTLPFSGLLDVEGADPSLIANVRVRPVTGELAVKPDYDGEQRVIGVDVILELPMKMYREKRAEILKDAYSLNKKLILKKEPVTYDTILLKNGSRCKVSHKLKVDGAKGSILQICHGEGKVSIDDISMVDQGLEIEGVLKVMILYASSEDQSPLASAEGVIPFRHTIDIPGISENCSWELNHCVEQMSAMMVSGGEIQVKAVILLDAFVCQEAGAEVVMDVKEEAFPAEEMEAMPGMIGYQVKDGEELWDIAKRYGTTEENICQLNDIGADQIRPGDRILLVKEVNVI